jgi:ribosomal protein L37AE/L43A
MNGNSHERRRGSPPPEHPPVRGVCPKCGRTGVFIRAGAGFWRCGKCKTAFPRGEIRDAPVREAPARQLDLFEGDGR